MARFWTPAIVAMIERQALLDFALIHAIALHSDKDAYLRSQRLRIAHDFDFQYCLHHDIDRLLKGMLQIQITQLNDCGKANCYGFTSIPLTRHLTKPLPTPDHSLASLIYRLTWLNQLQARNLNNSELLEAIDIYRKQLARFLQVELAYLTENIFNKLTGIMDSKKNGFPKLAFRRDIALEHIQAALVIEQPQSAGIYSYQPLFQPITTRPKSNIIPFRLQPRQP